MADVFALIDGGDADAVRAALAGDPSAASARDEQGLSAMMRAAYRGGPVFDAVREAHPPLDEWDRIMVGESDGLPAHGVWSPDGFTPLHLAVFARNAPAVRTLLKAGADPNAIATASFAQVSPLGTAANFGANEIATLLLEHSADTEATADHGFTSLHAAAANGNRDLVELLLAHGAKADARNENGQTPADLAANDETRMLLSS